MRCLKEAQPPRTPTELWSSLGFVNVYRRFTPSYTAKARTLYVLLQGNPKTLLPLGEEQVAAFRTLVKSVTSTPILSILKCRLRYSIDTDASSYQVGCALFQIQPNGKRTPRVLISKNDALGNELLLE